VHASNYLVFAAVWAVKLGSTFNISYLFLAGAAD